MVSEQDRDTAASKPAEAGFAAAAVSGSAWTTAQLVANKLVTVFATWAIARLLDPSDFGLANFAVGIGPFFFVLAPFVMGDVLLADPRNFDQISGAARRVAWTAAWALFVVLAACAIPIERLSGKPGIALLVVIVALRPIADSLLVVAYSRVRVELAYRRMAEVDGLVMLFCTVAGVAMALLGAGASSIVVPPIAALAIRGWIYWRLCGARISKAVTPGTQRSVTRRFAIAGFGQYVNNMVLSLEFVVLGFLSTEASTGFYALAYQIAVQANTIVAVQLGGVLQPIFGHIQHDPERQVAGFVRATRLLSAVAVPVSLAQAALTVPLFSLVFEPEWTGAIAPLVALSLGQAFMFVAAPSIALLKAQGRFATYLRWQVGQLVAAASLCVLAAIFWSDDALRVAEAFGLPTAPEGGAALAVSIASAFAWAASCPVAVYLGGRPAHLAKRSIVALFLQPWLVAVPATGVLVIAWMQLRAMLGTTGGDIATLVAVGPAITLAAILGCVWLRQDTREDFLRLLARIRRRKH